MDLLKKFARPARNPAKTSSRSLQFESLETRELLAAHSLCTLAAYAQTDNPAEIRFDLSTNDGKATTLNLSVLGDGKLDPSSIELRSGDGKVLSFSSATNGSQTASSTGTISLGPGSYTVFVHADNGTSGNLTFEISQGVSASPGLVYLIEAAILQQQNGWAAVRSGYTTLLEPYFGWGSYENLNTTKKSILDLNGDGKITTADAELARTSAANPNTATISLASVVPQDRTAPTISLALKNGSTTATTDPTLAGTINDASGIKSGSPRYSLDNGSSWAAISLDADGNYTIPASAFQTAGTYTVLVQATDTKGNGGSASLTVLYAGSTITTPTVADNSNGTVSLGTGRQVQSVNGTNFPTNNRITISGKGTITKNADGTLSFVADPAFYRSIPKNKTEIVSVQVGSTDSVGNIYTTPVEFKLVGVNDLPVRQDVAEEKITLNSGSSGSVTHATLLSRWSDPDTGTVLTISAASIASVICSNTDIKSFTPTSLASCLSNQNGKISFTATESLLKELGLGETLTIRVAYTVSDGDGGNVPGYLTFTVNGVNAKPTTANISIRPTSFPYTISQTEILSKGNAQDVNGNDKDKLTVSSVAVQSGDGSVSYVNGILTFMPDAKKLADTPVEQELVAVLTYTVADAHGGTASATITFNYNGTKKVFTASQPTVTQIKFNGTVVYSGTGSTFSYGGKTVDVPTVSANGQTLNESFDFAQAPSLSDTSFVPEGVVAEFTVQYTVLQNGNTTENRKTATISLTGVNVKPTVVVESMQPSVKETDGPTTINLEKYLTITDPNLGDVYAIKSIVGKNGTVAYAGGTLTVELKSGAVVSYSGNGLKITYSPNGTFDSLPEGGIGLDSLSLTITDGKTNGESTSIALGIQILGKNTAPTLNSIAATVRVGEAYEIDWKNMAKDVDQGDQLRITKIGGKAIAAGGTVTISGIGRFDYALDEKLTFTPDSVFDKNRDGLESVLAALSLTVADKLGLTATSTLSLTVVGANQRPAVDGTARWTTIDQVLSIDVENIVSDGNSGDKHIFVTIQIDDGSGTKILNATNKFARLDSGTTLRLSDDMKTLTIDGGTRRDRIGSDPESFNLSIVVKDDSGAANALSVETPVKVNILGIAPVPPKVVDPEVFLLSEKDATGFVLNLSDYISDENIPKQNGTAWYTISGFKLNSKTVGGVGISQDVSAFWSFSNGVLTFNPPTGIFDFLKEGVTLRLEFTYTTVDSFCGLSSSGKIVIEILGENDAPVFGGIVPSYTVTEGSDRPDQKISFAELLKGWTDKDHAKAELFLGNLRLESTDTDSLISLKELRDATGLFELDVVGRIISFNTSHEIFRRLGKGQSVELVFSYEAFDPLGDSGTGSFKIVVNGQNDAPIITTPEEKTSFEITNSGVPAGGTIDLGTFGAIDVDLDDSHAWSIRNVEYFSGKNSGKLPPIQIDAATGRMTLTNSNLSLAAGESTTLIFTVHVNDGSVEVGRDISVTVYAKKAPVVSLNPNQADAFVFEESDFNGIFGSQWSIAVTDSTESFASWTERSGNDWYNVGSTRFAMTLNGKTYTNSTISSTSLGFAVTGNTVDGYKVVLHPTAGLLDFLTADDVLTLRLQFTVHDTDYGVEKIVTQDIVIKGEASQHSISKVEQSSFTVWTNKRKKDSFRFEPGFSISDADRSATYSYSISSITITSNPDALSEEKIRSFFKIDAATGVVTLDDTATGNFVCRIDVFVSKTGVADVKQELTVTVKTASSPTATTIEKSLSEADNVGFTATPAFTSPSTEYTLGGLTSPIGLEISSTNHPDRFVAWTDEMKACLTFDSTTGRLSFVTDHVFDFLAEGETATAEFTYNIFDTIYDVSATGVIRLRILGKNTAPVVKQCLVIDRIALRVDSTEGSVYYLDKLASDIDFGDELTFDSISINGNSYTFSGKDPIVVAGYGTFIRGSDTTGKFLRFVPDRTGLFSTLLAVGEEADGFEQKADFDLDYTVVDAAGLKASGTINITMQGVNHIPKATSESSSFSESLSSPKHVLSINLGKHFTDVDLANLDDSLSFSIPKFTKTNTFIETMEIVDGKLLITYIGRDGFKWSTDTKPVKIVVTATDRYEGTCSKTFSFSLADAQTVGLSIVPLSAPSEGAKPREGRITSTTGGSYYIEVWSDDLFKNGSAGDYSISFGLNADTADSSAGQFSLTVEYALGKAESKTNGVQLDASGIVSIPAGENRLLLRVKVTPNPTLAVDQLVKFSLNGIDLRRSGTKVNESQIQTATVEFIHHVPTQQNTVLIQSVSYVAAGMSTWTSVHAPAVWEVYEYSQFFDRLSSSGPSAETPTTDEFSLGTGFSSGAVFDWLSAMEFDPFAPLEPSKDPFDHRYAEDYEQPLAEYLLAKC